MFQAANLYWAFLEEVVALASRAREVTALAEVILSCGGRMRLQI